MSSTSSAQNALAQTLKSLHRRSNTVLLANVHDGVSAQLVASYSSTTAIATSSYAIAATQGIDDDAMTLDQNLVGIRNVIAGLKRAGKWGVLPLSADVQDGYDDPGETVRRLIEVGVVGCNIEDVDLDSVRGGLEGGEGTLRSLEDAVGRVKRAVDAAREAGVSEFVVNARTDVLKFDGSMDDVVERGRKFLEVGATTVFVLPRKNMTFSRDEVRELVERLDGKLALQSVGLEVKELKELGVSRISVGSLFFKKSMQVFGEEVERMLSS